MPSGLVGQGHGTHAEPGAPQPPDVPGPQVRDAQAPGGQ